MLSLSSPFSRIFNEICEIQLFMYVKNLSYKEILLLKCTLNFLKGKEVNLVIHLGQFNFTALSKSEKTNIHVYPFSFRTCEAHPPLDLPCTPGCHRQHELTKPPSAETATYLSETLGVSLFPPHLLLLSFNWSFITNFSALLWIHSTAILFSPLTFF